MIQTIESVVCKRYGKTPEEIHSKCQDQELVFPRQVIMYYARLLTPMNWSDIGKHFGKNHATAIYSYNAVFDRIETDRKVRLELIEIDKEIGLGDMANKKIITLSICEGLESEIKKFEKKVDELRGMLKDIKNELKNLK